MVLGDAAFPCVVQTPGERRAFVESRDGGAAQRAKAHPRNICDRGRTERLPAAAMGSQNLGTGQPVMMALVAAGSIRRRVRERTVLDDQIIGRDFQIVIGAKAKVVVFFLGRGVDPAALIAAKWALFVIAGNDVLPQLGSDRFKQVTEVAEDGEVAQNGMLALAQIVDGEPEKASKKDAKNIENQLER